MNFDKFFSSIWLYFLILFSSFPFFGVLRGGDFEDFLKVFFVSFITFIVVSIGLSFLSRLAKENYYDLIKQLQEI